MQALMALMADHVVAVVFAVTLAARLGLPVPAAPVLVVAGGLAAAAQPLLLAATVLAALVGNVLGDGAWFYAGRRYGHRIMRLLCRISLSPDSCVRQSEALLTRWGGLSLVAAKFVPGVSVVAPPMAGALGMSSLRFLGFESGAALLWTGAFLGLGALFRAQIGPVLDVLAEGGGVATVALVAALALTLAVRYRRRRAFLALTRMPRVGVEELQALLGGDPPPLVVDVRGEASLQIDPRHIPGAIALSLKPIQQRRSALPFDDRERDIVLYCNCPNEGAAALAARALAARGFRRARPLAGGLDAWIAAGRPTGRYPSPQRG